MRRHNNPSTDLGRHVEQSRQRIAGTMRNRTHPNHKQCINAAKTRYEKKERPSNHWISALTRHLNDNNHEN